VSQGGALKTPARPHRPAEGLVMFARPVDTPALPRASNCCGLFVPPREIGPSGCTPRLRVWPERQGTSPVPIADDDGERGSQATSPMVPLAVRCRIRGQERLGERPLRSTTPGRRGNQGARRVMSEQLRMHTRPSRAFRKMVPLVLFLETRPSDLHSGTRRTERGARGGRPGPHDPKSPLQPQGGLTPPLPRADPAPGLEARSPGHFADSGTRRGTDAGRPPS